MEDKWLTVDTLDDHGTKMALQQKYQPDTIGNLVPTDDHRLVPVTRLLEDKTQCTERRTATTD